MANPPVPLPVYPHTMVGMCLTCGHAIQLTGAVFPARDATNEYAYNLNVFHVGAMQEDQRRQ